MTVNASRPQIWNVYVQRNSNYDITKGSRIFPINEKILDYRAKPRDLSGSRKITLTEKLGSTALKNKTGTTDP